MIRAADERFVLGSKENLSENMEAFSLKVNIFYLIIAIIKCNIRSQFPRSTRLLQFNHLIVYATSH